MHTKKHSANGVEAAMLQYNHLIQKMDADSISLLYTADGDLGTMANGRDSIRNFLLRFKNMHVLTQSSVPDSIQLNGDTSLQTGSYKQKVVVAPKDTVNVKGTFTAKWVWTGQSGWLIKKMETKPL